MSTGFAAIQVARAGENLHLQHGPIDLLLHAEGDPVEVENAYRNASSRFEAVLTDLVQELPLLRTILPGSDSTPAASLRGHIAQAMFQACLPYIKLREKWIFRRVKRWWHFLLGLVLTV